MPNLPKPKLPKLNDLPSSFPEEPPPGPFRREFWRSPLRGPWLTAFLGSMLLPLIVICAVTGFLSHIAYRPDLGSNSVTGGGGIGFDLYFFNFPTSPSWGYALTQGLHIGSGLTAIPILFAKLWSAMPKLFEWPPMRSLSHMLDRLSLALLVGGSLFVFFTGVLNIQLWYPWKFSFVPAHYYGAFIFLAALGLHLVTKIPIALNAFREKGVLTPLKDDLAHTVAEPHVGDSTAPLSPRAPTMSRRGLIGMVGAGSLGLAIMAGGQSIGGPFRKLAFLAPRGPSISDEPNGFLINRTFAAAVIEESEVGSSWTLKLEGAEKMELTRDELLAMPQQTYSLPIACVEGWSTTQSWTGVPLRDLAELSGAPAASELLTTSLQTEGGFSQATLSDSQAGNEQALLALKVNGEDLSLDHGFPARIIAPGTPGVHCTKWVDTMTFAV